MVLPKSMRLKGHRCFSHLHKTRLRFYSSSMVLKVSKENPALEKSHKNYSYGSKIKVAISISNKVSKKAVVRNRLRRLFHDHLKVRLKTIVHNLNNWALISLKPISSNKEPSILLKECDKLLRESGLLS